MRSWQVFYGGQRGPVVNPYRGSGRRVRPSTRAKRVPNWQRTARRGGRAAESGALVTTDIPGATPQEPRDPC